MYDSFGMSLSKSESLTETPQHVKMNKIKKLHEYKNTQSNNDSINLILTHIDNKEIQTKYVQFSKGLLEKHMDVEEIN